MYKRQVQGILAALLVRERSGRGQLVESSLLEGQISWLTYHAVSYFASGEVPERLGSGHASVAPYGAYPTQDGFLVIAVATDALWKRFCTALGQEQLIEHPELRTNPQRCANRELMDALRESARLAQPQAAGNTTIDVMLLYTSGMASRYGAGLQARLDSLIALANQAYIDSQVNITLRLVYSTQVNYSDTAVNKTALDDLTNNSAPSLTQVNAWRDQYGADLVALLRPYSVVNHGGCGLGWLNGFNGSPISGDQAYGYAVVSDGSDIHGSNSCLLYTSPSPRD